MHGPMRGEAVLHFYSGHYDVVKPGSFVRCAITGREIPLDELRYWDFERQEAYATPEIAHARWIELNGAPKP